MKKSNDTGTKYECLKCKGTGMILYKENGYDMAKECDCGIREKQALESQLQFANIPEQFKDVRLSNFSLDIFDGIAKTQLEKAYKAVKGYYENFDKYREDGYGLYLFSTCKGSGKTRMAVSLANELIYERHISVKFCTSIQILNEIKASWDSESDTTESRLLEHLSTTPVLIIDDFGTEKTKDWITERFYHIINERYINKKITIFTSNYSITDIDYDDRITDRISEKCFKIPFPNVSVRQIRARDNQAEFMKQFM